MVTGRRADESKTAATLAILLLVALALVAPRLDAQQPGAKAAAATENELSTKEALAQMRAGGNAIDAAVTAALVAGVASPSSSGIGGGGFVVVWLAQDKKAIALDFREVAPAGVDAAALERRPLPANERAQLTGVPGEVAGLFELHRRYGKRPWKDVVEPAARAAKSGFPINPHVASMLTQARADLERDPGISAVFYPNGKPAAVGRVVKNGELGATLDALAAQGPKFFYEGSTASALASAAKSAGGALSTEDLARYKPKERTPLHVSWEGYDVYTMPPPSAGGLMLAETLGLFSSDELKKLGFGSAAYDHVLAEAMRGAFADRMRYLGDPDFQKLNLDALLAKSRMDQRKKTIAIDRTHAMPRFGLEEHGTHHIVTADAAGNVVALTTTVNTVFGTKLTAPPTGIVLNDQVDDFNKKKDVEAFGMSETPNRPRPGARPISSMTPTIVVKDGAPVFALGGSGGTTIATNVTQILIARLVFAKSPAELVKSQRFYVPAQGATIRLEQGAPASLIADLRYRGEIVGPQPFTTSGVQMIAIENGKKLPAADPRKHGSAIAE